MSILATSPTSTRHFDMNIAAALGSMEAAVILQQLHYWTGKEGIGVKIDNAKYIYNSFSDWVSQQFTFLSKWKFRKAMSLLRSLEIVEVIRYKSKQWNQTNYYSLNYERLKEWAQAEGIEISEMWGHTPQDDNNQTLEMTNSDNSIYESKITTKDGTTKQFAAALAKMSNKEEKSQSSRNNRSTKLTASIGQINEESTQINSNPNEEKKVAQVDYIVNKEWSKLIPLLDSAGVSINRTIKDLLKLYPAEKVENAIALVRARKREQHIPNLGGYFVSALKGDWGARNLVSEEYSGDRFNQEVDRDAVFRHWYDLARALGYCSSQEMRKGEQWICLSGSWEKWEAAVKRGYSLDYLKKIMKRNSS